MDDGRDETSGARRAEPTAHREPDVAPPGSRERAESDLTGWNPARDEESSTRQGRYHRAATLRMSQPRTQMDDAPDTIHGAPPENSGPYGRDDRDSRYADGWGPRYDSGEQDVELSPQHAEYRAWDRSGYGGGRDEPFRPQGPHEARAPMRHGDARPRYRTDRGHGDTASSTSASRDRDEASTHRPQRVGMSVYTAVAGRPEETTYRYEGPGTSISTTTGGRPESRASRAGRRWQHEPLSAREVMTRNVRTARRDSPLRDVAQIMKDESCGAVPIVDERGRLVGIVTDRDLVVRAFTGSRSPEQLRVSDVMTDDVEAVTPEDTLQDVIGLMGRRQLRRIPVVERDDCIVGIISLGDIALRADQDEELQHALERISAKRSFWSRLG
ncbi:CBS domain protein [Myxococcus hansupus]|uniref:CBS domain protein n=2 Tax=Pseudomyxococcus hansupus TaxID=1297742 RepID=A0A0H4XPD3_9BACT|nr:CBS domain protein [Myxococcus hansupus]